MVGVNGAETDKLSLGIRGLAGGSKEMEVFLLAAVVDGRALMSQLSDEEVMHRLRKRLDTLLPGIEFPEPIPEGFWTRDRIQILVENVKKEKR